ncbi:hypothetical protein M426DRAFT_320062 [Hypoxylon sp. CI-4A]|nr:hypothetical protein M426DRAFT_320062 [Hypoxylon sp. CI-4A]
MIASASISNTTSLNLVLFGCQNDDLRVKIRQGNILNLKKRTGVGCAALKLQYARYDAYVFVDPKASQFDQAPFTIKSQGTSRASRRRVAITNCIFSRIAAASARKLYTALSDAYLSQPKLVASMSQKAGFLLLLSWVTPTHQPSL